MGRQLFVVADGLGGHRGGDVASSMLVERLDDLDTMTFTSAEQAQEALLDAIRDANRLIYERAQREPEREGMGTTCTAALLHGDELLFGQVGDTRAYLLRGADPPLRVTPDHSFVAALVEAGYISAEEARTHPQRSVILRAIGQQPQVDVDCAPPVPLLSGDLVVLCSDGVSGVVDDATIAGIARSKPIEEAVDALVEAALAAGGPDNITVVILAARG